MAWETRKIEDQLKELLQRDCSGSKADEYYGQYTEARRKLVENILPEIKAIENNLTDHSEDHIADVLDNVYQLLGDHVEKLQAIELYFLCLTVLFHDVGNIYGRKGHYDKMVIQRIYNYVRNGESKFNPERNLVCLAASTHSGLASDGSTDTMKELPNTDSGLFSEGISLRKLAPVLRFADELAEGPQRTSDFMLLSNLYERESMIHHKYAQITNVYIDRGNKRISITYDIDIETLSDGSLSVENRKDLVELLEYAYSRIIKLNDERRFNKFYSRLLEPFQRTDVSFNFNVNGLPCDIGLEDISITDLTLPGNGILQVPEINSDYDLVNLIDKIENTSKNIHQDG